MHTCSPTLLVSWKSNKSHAQDGVRVGALCTAAEHGQAAMEISFVDNGPILHFFISGPCAGDCSRLTVVLPRLKCGIRKLAHVRVAQFHTVAECCQILVHLCARIPRACARGTRTIVIRKLRGVLFHLAAVSIAGDLLVCQKQARLTQCCRDLARPLK